MSLKAGKVGQSDNSFPKLEPGVYAARLVQLIDMGVQPQTDYQTGEYKGDKPEVMFTFELPTETITIKDEERPRWVGKSIPLSWNEKSNFVKYILAVGFKEGKTQHLRELLGNPCMVNMGRTSGDKEKIVGVTVPMKGFPIPPLANESKLFDFDDPDVEVFLSFPEWIQEKIKSAVNFPGSKLSNLLEQQSNNQEGWDGESNQENNGEDDSYDDGLYNDLPY